MTISFSSSNLRDDATSGNGDYRLDKLPETTPSTSVFDRADVTYRQFTELHGQARDTRREAHVVERSPRPASGLGAHPCMRLSSSRTTALPGGTSHALSE
ncbi:transcriptional regulator [Mycobacterium tuberculosis]|nr:transcriptional regulator [Mycobacterium tuberculosis]CKU30784.1 transcriptional regulator [Mycobacterium tuberculosis]